MLIEREAAIRRRFREDNHHAFPVKVGGAQVAGFASRGHPTKISAPATSSDSAQVIDGRPEQPVVCH